jgi:hypothetical protein
LDVRPVFAFRTGNSYFADDFPDANQADDLLAAFKVSAKLASPGGAFLD